MPKTLNLPPPKTVLKHCGEFGLDRKALASCMAVNPKTIERWEEGVEPGEGALRSLEKLEAIYLMASSLLKKGRMKTWFQSPNPSLSSEKPIELLSRGELDRVRNVLGMLEWGIYS